MLLFSVVSEIFNPAVANVAHAAMNDEGDNAILSYKGDHYPTGQSAHETALTRGNVNANQFGKRVTYPVDGQVYAQPLFMPNLTINGAAHNVVFVVTEHDSIYAFDADQTTPAQPLWYNNFLINGATTVPATDIYSDDIVPDIGITGTPVIDRQTNTMYFVTYTKENGNLVYRLHAVDITTGKDKSGSPIVIQGSVPGSGAGSANGNIAFDARYERQRAGLLLANGQVYVAFGSFTDHGPYHGWIMSYNNQLQQTAIYNDTSDGIGAGLWSNLASDNDGNIYAVSGNGDFNLNTGGSSAGDSFIKLSPQLKLLDYFAPFNQSCMAADDTNIDLGSSGPLVVPGTNRIIGVGKEGRVYVLDNSNMGKYTQDPQLNCSSDEHARTDIDHVVQELPPSTAGVFTNPAYVGAYFGTPAYWNHTIFFAGTKDHIKAFSFNNGVLSTTPTSQSSETLDWPGGNPTISSVGDDPNTGILWVIDPGSVLRAYNASDLSKELYNSNANANRDALDSFVKFSVPTVANGRVFVGTKTSLTIYGLL
jgi:hypothetical protein